jgi:hypothetical protein
VAATFDTLSRTPDAWRNLKARPASVARPACCRSCGEALSPGMTARPRCAACVRAVQLVLRRVREADLR